MFSIFAKKFFLADILEGMTDIHCHILPGIDDGAKNIENSIAILKQYGQMGIEKFIATPHIMLDYYPNTKSTIENAYESLNNALSKNGLSHLNISTAAEYMMDNHFESLLDQSKILPLKDNYILVETSFLQAPYNLDNIIYDIHQQGFIPVIAHPERYSYFSGTKNLEQLKQSGCLFQLNALSMSNYYGKDVQKKAGKLLDGGFYDFIGTDTHRLMHLYTLKEIKTDAKKNSALQQLVEDTRNTFGG